MKPFPWVPMTIREMSRDSRILENGRQRVARIEDRVHQRNISVFQRRCRPGHQRIPGLGSPAISWYPGG